MHATGASTREVRRIAEKTGVPRLSKGRVSAIAASLDADIEEPCGRPPGGAPVPYVRLDATRVKCRRGGRVASTAVATAIGCGAGGRRRVPGVDAVDTEPYGSRPAFLRRVRGRGVSGVELVASDAHPGLARALGEAFRGAAWQRCAVHLMRDRMREAGSLRPRRRIGRILSPAFGAGDAATAPAMHHVARDMLETCRPRAAAVLGDAEPDAPAYLDFPPPHRRRLRADNVQERANRETKRGPRVVQVLPSTGSLARLAGAVMCEQDETWQGSRYFSEAKMNELYDERRAHGIDGPVDWTRLEVDARSMVESSVELADRAEAA